MHPNALTGEHRLGEGRSRHLAWRIVVIALAAIVMAIVTMGLGGGDDSASGASTEQAPFFCARQIPC